MKVYVLAAGYATRLYPLTHDCAKPLLEVGELPILTRILDRALALPRVSEAIVIGNDRFAADFDAWQENYASRIPVRVLNDGSRTAEDRLGAIGDMAFALEQVPLEGEDWLVVAGDNLLEFDLASAQRHFEEERCPTLVVREREPEPPGPSRYNEVLFDARGTVTRFTEKPDLPASPHAAIAVYFFTPAIAGMLVQYLTAGGLSDAPGHFIAWLAGQTRVTAAPLRGEWHDIGDLTTLEAARALNWPPATRVR